MVGRVGASEIDSSTGVLQVKAALPTIDPDVAEIDTTPCPRQVATSGLPVARLAKICKRGRTIGVFHVIENATSSDGYIF
jgi:hypothetical protein